MTLTPRHAIALCSAATLLAGCASQPTGEAAPAEAQQADRAQPDQGAGAPPVVRPAERQVARLDPAMKSQGPTALSAPISSPNAAVPPPTREEWQPDWYTGSVVERDNLRFGSAVATHRDLLEARRLAVTEAFNLLDSGAIDQTVTRQLKDGRFRVWVRIAADN